MDFLQLLRNELRDGLHGTPASYRSRHAAWLAAQQLEGGGFANRRGMPDLYYTTFGLRALSCLNAVTPAVAERALEFLNSEIRAARHPFRDAVHAVSWWDAVKLCEEAGAALAEEARDEAHERTRLGLAALRRMDGGWAKHPQEGNGSLYHSFLAALTFRRMGETVPEFERLSPFLAGLIDASGGFRENSYSKRPGANATAAGVALTLLLKSSGLPGLLAGWGALRNALSEWASRDLRAHGSFLIALQNDEGGFQATPNAPFADLLSTYTALFTLKNIAALDERSLARGASYARALELPEGGYVGFALEADPDCEYTFYGLGVAGLEAATS